MASFNPLKIANKQKRRAVQLKIKKQKESTRRDERLRRRRFEDKNPHLREERRAKNVPMTIDKKRVWDQIDGSDEVDAKLALSIDLTSSKRRKVEGEDEGEVNEEAARQKEMSGPSHTSAPDQTRALDGDDQEEDEDEDDLEREVEADDEATRDQDDGAESNDDLDSFLDSDSEDNGSEDGADTTTTSQKHPPHRPPSEAPSVMSTATDLNTTPEALMQRFPTLFNNDPERDAKVLITTSINATIYDEAHLLTTIFPNSTFIRRTAHYHSYKYSVREISKYAASRGYSCVMVLNEERKKPKGLDIVHLPDGPMFHFSISNWISGAKIPGHGNPTNHYPELILNGFRTPLGMLAAHLFKSLFPARPEVHGRQVVTLHNQRDYIFFRRHRYVFRDKRATEKSIQGADGKPVKGVEDIRAGLQELGPRFTLKLRRVDKGIQRASGQEWVWKAHDEKARTRFSL